MAIVTGILLMMFAQLLRISMQLAIASKRRTEKWELLSFFLLMLVGGITFAISLIVFVLQHVVK
jgi:hypothetical protein